MNLIKYFRGRMSAVRRDHLTPHLLLSFSSFSFFFFLFFSPRHGAIYFFNVRNELNALYPFLFRRVPFSHPVLPIPAIVSPLASTPLDLRTGPSFPISIFLHCPCTFATLVRFSPRFFICSAHLACHFVFVHRSKTRTFSFTR